MRVLVGMSGGIDSSVAATLLKQRGYDIAGVFLYFWNNPNIPEGVNRENSCCSTETLRRAEDTAAKLDMPFYTLNMSEPFKQAVVDYFIDAYAKGLTPNPCIVCNDAIKFGLLFEKARAMGFDAIATGHYARIQEGKNGFELLRGRDEVKDQSYFLYTLDQERLPHILFPVGEYTKTEVRSLARSFGLPEPERPESQELCFLGGVDYRDFLKDYSNAMIPGDIVDTHGTVLGQHKGLPWYTLGQRKGLGLGGGKPYYVARLDQTLNHVIVTSDTKDILLTSETVALPDAHFVNGPPQNFPYSLSAKIRSQGRFVPVTLEAAERGHRVRFKTPERAVMPGQSAVLYEGDRVIGGGIMAADEAAEPSVARMPRTVVHYHH